MTQAKLADGRVLNFPDGTDPAVIQATVKRLLSKAEPERVTVKEGQVADFGDGPVVMRDGQLVAIPQSEADEIRARQTAPTAREATGDVLEGLGIDTSLDRGVILPIATDPATGEGEFALPQIATETLRAVLTPGAAAKGARVDAQDILNTALIAGPAALRGGIKGAARAANPAAREIVESGKKLDVPVMTTDVFPPKGVVGGLARQTGERIPVAGTTGPRIAQQKARERAVSEFASEFPPINESDIISSLKVRKQALSKKAGDVLEKVKTRLSGVDTIDIADVNKTIDDLVDDLSEAGRIQDPIAIERLKSVKDSLNAGPQPFDILRDNRTTIRETLEQIDPTGRSQLTSRAKAQFQKVYDSITRTLDAEVKDNLGEAALRQYKQADGVFFRQANTLRKTRLKNVLDKGDLTPETVNNLVFSSKPSEVKLLFRSLNTEGRKNVRGALVSRAVEKATVEDALDPSRFAKELNKLKTGTEVFFRGEDAKRLRGLKVLIQATRRAKDAAAVTPTGQSLLPILAAGAGSQVGFFPAIAAMGTAGGAARLYESRAVRNMLLELGSSGQKNSAKIIDKHSGAILDTIRRLSGPALTDEVE